MYRPIGDYGIIGDMHAVALVSRDGSIDYCTMPHIDSPTVFAALLDDEKGGFFSVQPIGAFESVQTYLGQTNILACQFKTRDARAQLVDFMPVSGSERHEKDGHVIHRCLKVEAGMMRFHLKLYARPNFARDNTRIIRQGDRFTIATYTYEFTFAVRIHEYAVASISDGGIELTFTLSDNEAAHFDFAWGDILMQQHRGCAFSQTQTFWRDWVHRCAAGTCESWGEYSAMVTRSLLALKLLTFEPTGAIAAAATTSLPETIGGERNWDYRFTWLRDASLTLKAMFALGHITEADAFIQWLHNVYHRHGSTHLQIMYSLTGERELKEEVLDHLKGYRDSRPVRIGNGAYRQTQLDIYGEIMDTALRLSDYVGKIDEDLWPFFRDVVILAAEHWQEPDDGIWEVRNGPFHFVYSKIMCWVALDRGMTIARRYGFDAPLESWQATRDAMRQEIIERGVHAARGAFVQRYDSEQLDASLLLAALMDFLPIHDTRLQETINVCQKELMQDGFLLRYTSEDGLHGREAGFVICNFWLIECLVRSGRLEEARECLQRTTSAANHLGLFSEEFDPRSGELMGNFPQALSHIGYLNAVVSLMRAEQKSHIAKARHVNVAERLRKLMPVRVVLNQATSDAAGRSSDDLASKLKSSLGRLQGAYFDIWDSRVDYMAMRASQGFRSYVELAAQLRTFDPYQLQGDNEKKAFWMNIYNILIIHGVIHLDVQKSVQEVFNFFRRIGYNIGGTFFSPDDIEHGILRSNRTHPYLKIKQFSKNDIRVSLCVEELDARIHFALVCAASSCPPIEFYDAARIDAQLDTAARSFIRRRGLELDRPQNRLSLSQIFQWYRGDFGGDIAAAVQYAARFADAETSAYIQEHAGELSIHFLPYNWNLNQSLTESVV